MIHIRKGIADDVPLMMELIHALAKYERAQPGELSVTAEQLHESLFGPSASAEAIIAFVDDQAAGFAIFFHNFSTWRGKRGLYLEDLFVRPESRGCGVGKALLRELATIAASRDCARMEWSVLDWNQPAIDFYKSLGAKPKDEWTVYRLEEQAIRELAGRDL